MSSVQRENFQEFLESNVLHMRSVILDQFSSVQLLRLAMTNKSMREMSITELGRRTLKINIYEEDTELVDNIYNPTTIIRLRENGSCHLEVIPNVDMEWLYIELRDGTRRQKKFREYNESHPWIASSAQIVTSLLQYSRVAELDMGKTMLGEMYAWYNGRSTIERSLYLGRLTISSDFWYFRALDYLMPKHLVVIDDGYYDDGLGPQMFIQHHMNRGIVQARELEITVNGSDSRILLFLSVLQAPIINLREQSRLDVAQALDLIRQWQDGQRKIVAFSACVLLTQRHDLDAFCRDMLAQLDDATVTDYPADHEMPQRILDQITKTEEVQGSSQKSPRAVAVLGDDGKKLVILLKAVLNQEVAAIGMFEVAAV